MRTSTENSLADVVKAIRYLEPDKDDAVLIESLLRVLGYKLEREPQSPPPPKRIFWEDELDHLSEDSSRQKPQPLLPPKKRKSLSKLQLNTLKEPQGNTMPIAIRDAIALWDHEPEMPTVSLKSFAPSIPLLPVNQARTYIHDTLSTEVCLGELDVDELIEQMASGAIPTITYIRKKQLQGPVHVMIDKNRSMEPFEHDADELYHYITNLVGKEVCEGYWCFETPDDEVVRISDNEWLKDYPSLKPLSQTLLVLVSDLGAARPFGWSPLPWHRWSVALKRLALLFSRIVVVSPYPKKRLHEIRTRNIEIVSWGKVRYACSGDEESVLHDLASLIAPAAYINRDIIRSARATFYPECYPGLEADLIFSWMMAVSNPLVLSFRPETQKKLREGLRQDTLLRKRALDFLHHYREHGRQFKLPEWIAFEEDLMQQALNGERQAVDGKVRRLIRTLIKFEEHPRLARWTFSLAKRLSEEHASLKDLQALQFASALRLGVVPKEFEQSGEDNSNSWLLPKETTIGIRHEEGQFRFIDKPDVDDIRISVPGTVPRFLKIEGGDGTNQLVRLWKGHDDVMVSERLLPMVISTLSGARYSLGEPEASFRKVTILIAAPSDVNKERMVVANEIKEWNIHNSDSHRIVCEAVFWDTHSQTTIGEGSQESIDSQIVDGCDFAIVVFHSRIGADTGLALGGTVEEVRRMIDQGKQVLCWFSEMPLPLDIDVEQLVQLKNFRNELQSKATCDTYKDLNDFRQKVAYQLAQYMSFFTQKPAAAISNVMTGQLSPEANKALMRYQKLLRREIERIALIGVPAIEGLSVALSEVFISLRLSTTGRSVERFRSGMLDDYNSGTPEEVMRFAFSNHRLLLVIGDPGSGKSTLLNYYALSCLEGIHESLGFTAPVPVIRLPLREMKRKKDGYSSLPASLADWCTRNSLDEIEQEHCAEWLAKSEMLVLLDGLDEISDMKDRISMCHWIGLMVKSYSNARFVVTSRSTGYRKVDGIEIQAPYVQAAIMDLTQEQQKVFLIKWFQAAYLCELQPEDLQEQEWQEMQIERAREKSEAIVQYLNQKHNNGLRVLASQPLLLQIMALLWKERGYLPGSRTKLLDAALDYLLEYRDRQKNINPLLSAKDARQVLGSVALWMQATLKMDEVSREAMHEQVQKVLDTLPGLINASAFCRYLVERSGVLVEYGDNQYVFRMKVFREYLAAEQLATDVYRTSSYLDDLVSHFGDEWWEETLRFFIAQVDQDTFDFFMQKMFESEISLEFSVKQQNLLQTLIVEAQEKRTDALCKKLLDAETSVNRQRYILDSLRFIAKPSALDALTEFQKNGLAKDERIYDLSEKVALELESKLQKGVATINVQPEKVIIKADDTYKLTKSFRNSYENDAQYILIPGGKYLYSVTKREVRVPDLYFAKYPVTNKQYLSFVQFLAGNPLDSSINLKNKDYEKVLHDYAENLKYSNRGFIDYLGDMQDLAQRFSSKYYDSKRYYQGDEPVVALNWYDVIAYCVWLSFLESDGKETSIYRLPTGIEWEWAAGGRRERPDKVLAVRNYPWGDIEPTVKYANYNKNEGSPTPVGRYPDGATPEGLYDMGGNVWEWMENWYDENNSAKALRGGSWYSTAFDLSCSARIGNVPIGSNGGIGFRVVRSSPPLKVIN